jgi:hypothetical protein
VTARAPRSGEFFAPLPLSAVAMMIVNDHWLKPAFHSALTGKLSDIAICFFMPLFVSEVLGIAIGMRPVSRLAAGALVTALLYTGLEVVPSFTAFAIRVLSLAGPYLGVRRPFRMTADWSDLWCLALVPLAVAYGRRRLLQPIGRRRSRAFS